MPWANRKDGKLDDSKEGRGLTVREALGSMLRLANLRCCLDALIVRISLRSPVGGQQRLPVQILVLLYHLMNATCRFLEL